MGTYAYTHTPTSSPALKKLSEGAGGANEYVTNTASRGKGVLIHILDDGYKPITPKTATSYDFSWRPTAQGTYGVIFMERP